MKDKKKKKSVISTTNSRIFNRFCEQTNEAKTSSQLYRRPEYRSNNVHNSLCTKGKKRLIIETHGKSSYDVYTAIMR